MTMPDSVDVLAIDWRVLLTLPNFIGSSAIGGAILSRLPFGLGRERELTLIDDDPLEAPKTKTRRSKAKAEPAADPTP